MAIIIKEVTTKRQLKAFVDFPNKLYKENPYFIPALYADDIEDLIPAKNPAFDYSEAKCFLAYDGTTVVGRIAVILNTAANEKWHTNAVRFSQVDFIDDYEVSSRLFEAAENYAREKGCNQIIGPLGFCDLDREGMLIEGFDQRSLFYTYYNAPYYLEHLERLGYKKNYDWLEYKIAIPAVNSDVSKKLKRISDAVSQRYNLRIPEIKRAREFMHYLKQIFHLLNVCYAHLDGTVLLTDKQILRYAKKYISIIDPRFTCIILDSNNDVVAFGITVPSIDAALKKNAGRLFPLGWVDILRSLKKSESLDMLLVAVTPELQGMGVNAMLLNYVLENAQKLGIKYAETGPQLVTNTNVQSQWKMFETTQHKLRRCFTKTLA